MKNPRKFYISLFLLFILGSGIIGYNNTFNHHDKDEDSLSHLLTFFQMMHRVKQNYVNVDKVSNQKLIYGALKGMMNSLDEYSEFYEPVRSERITIETEGKYGGLGIYVREVKDGLQIQHVIKDTPAERCGLQKNDIIQKVDNKSFKNFNQKQSLQLLKGAEGSEVLLSIFRPDEEKTLEIKSIREIIKIPSISNSKVLDNKIAYMRILQFNRPAAGQFYKELNTFINDKDCQALIIDLRNNPGGLLHSAISICSNFVKEGELLVFTEGRNNEIKERYHSLSGQKFNKLPIVILINAHSASASELMATCLKDYKVAVSIGEKSYGKGSVQSFLSLNDGSSAKFTSAYYFTPGKHLIHGNGVEPDLSIKLTKKEKLDFQKGFTAYETEEHVDKVLQSAHGILSHYLVENQEKFSFKNLLQSTKNYQRKDLINNDFTK